MTVAAGEGFNIANGDTGGHAIKQTVSFYYKVAATNAVGTGPLSNEAKAAGTKTSRTLAAGTALGVTMTRANTFTTCSGRLKLAVKLS